MRTRPLVLTAVLVTLALVFAGCGGSSSKSSSGNGNANPDAKKLQAVIASFDITAAGAPQRLLLGLETGDGRLIGFGTVQVQAHPDKAKPAATNVTTASFLAIPGTQVPQPPPANATLVDAAHGRGVYAANVVLDAPGTWRVDVDATVEGLGHVTTTSAFTVSATHTVIAIADQAPASKTLTVAAHEGAPLTAVDSRAQQGSPVPDPELHSATIAAAVSAHHPLVVVFSTPVYCQSKFCGPITDLVQDVSRQYASRATFVHVEIYKDYEKQVLNDAVYEWLQKGNGDINEPWVFVVGSDGKVTARFDNVVTRDELVGAINALK